MVFDLINRIDYEMKSFSGRYAVYANDFKSNIEVNSDELWESASCIKTFILAALMHEVNQGNLDLDNQLTYKKEHHVNGSGILQSLSVGLELPIRDVATLMIIVSDNIATNMLIDLIGLSTINDHICVLGFSQTKLFNKLDFDQYSRLGQTTAREYGQLFEMIYKGSIYTKKLCCEMLDILSKQHYNSLLSRKLPQWLLDAENTGEEEVLKIASKSGSMDNCRNDGGVIFTPFGDFIVVVFTKDFKDKIYYSDHESYRFAPNITRMLFDQFIAKKGCL